MQKSILALGGVLLGSSVLLGTTISDKSHNSSLIVYNSNIGLVHEERELTLTPKEKQIIYEGVASSINTDSINVKLDPSVTLSSQQYRFDKLTQAKLLEAHIGKKVNVRRLKNSNEFQLLSATLLAYNGEKSIVKTTDYQILTVKSSSIIFETIPKQLITKPSLVWNVDVAKNVKTKLELDYLINNVTFKSDYVLNLDANSSDISGWITIDNRSGKSFKDTKLSLLAGDINRATQAQPYQKTRNMALMSAPQEVVHQAYEGYHFYTIPFKVTLANNEKTQIKFIDQKHIPTTRQYSANLMNPLYLQGERRVDVMQYLLLDGLNLPLPKGIVRSYSKLQDQTILLGETNIDHTPKDTPIKLKIGKNFDLKVTQTILKREDTSNWFDADVEYTLKNSSDKAKNITLYIPFNRQNNSSVKSDKSYSYTKGNLVTFTLLVAPNTSEKFQVHFESKK